MTGARYLLDTNTASYAIRGNPPTVVDRLNRVQTSETAISAVTEAELLFGLARKPTATSLREIVHRFLRKITILPWGSAAAREYARLRASQQTRGFPLGELDTMIAAQAMAEDLVLVTNDAAFRHVPGLKLEDWTKPLPA